MDVTSKLLRVYLVDKQLRGLKGRLKGAERFLSEQDKDLTHLESSRSGLEGQMKHLQAQAKEAEGEVKRLDTRMATIRTQMDSAQNNKEYKAFLTELNTYKVDRDKHEATALELMTKADAIKAQLSDVATKKDEREKVRKVAAGDRDAKHGEVAGRMEELSQERATLVKEVPDDVMKIFQRLLDTRGDEAMGPVEVVDARRHEFHCGVCMMSLPVDAVSLLISSGKLTRCASCQCVLFMDDAAKEAMQPPTKKSKAPKKDRENAEDIAKSEKKAKKSSKKQQEEEAVG